MQHSVKYTLLFAAAVCVVCTILVSSSAVSLSELQQANARLDKMKNVLMAAGLAEATERLSAEDINERFRTIEAVAIELETGLPAPDIDTAAYDQRKAAADPATSREAPPNLSVIKRLPNHAVVYQVLNNRGEVSMLVFTGRGLRTLVHALRLPGARCRYENHTRVDLLPAPRNAGLGRGSGQPELESPLARTGGL